MKVAAVGGNAEVWLGVAVACVGGKFGGVLVQWDALASVFNLHIMQLRVSWSAAWKRGGEVGKIDPGLTLRTKLAALDSGS